MRQVYDRHLGPNWTLRASDATLWDRMDAIDDGELWETHQTLKVQLIETVRRRVKETSGVTLDWEIKRIGVARE